MRITGGGNVGIGTTSPTLGKLQITGDNNQLALHTAGTYSSIYFYNAGNDRAGIYVSDTETHIEGRGTSGLFFGGAVSQNHMIITSGGNVGINTTSPATKLQISGVNNDSYGQLRLLATGTGADAQISFETPLNGRGIYVDDSDTNKMKFYTGAGKGTGDMVTFDNSGNVGIGSTSPLRKLVVGGDTNIKGSIVMGGITDSGGLSTGVIYMLEGQGIAWYNSAFNAGRASIQGTSAGHIVLSPTANVGIGTTSPSYLLHVAGTGYFGGTVGFEGEGNGLTIDTGYGNNGRVGLMKYGGLEGMLVAGNTTVLRLGHRTDSDNVATSGAATIRVDMLINAAGNVGIGTTSPGSLLHTYTTTAADNAGHIQYENANTGTGAATNAQLIGKSKYGTAQLMVWENYGIRFGMRSTANSGAGDIYFTTGTDSVQMVIKGGNVGIGTTSPYSRLTIGGALSTGTSQISILNTEGGHYIIRTGIAGLQNQGLSIISADADGSNQNTRIAIASSGNVGIGTTSPTYKLDVSGSINIAASNYYRIGGNAVAFVSGNEVQYGNQGGSQFVTISTGTTEKLRIQTDGNVGIGTTSPSSVLDVVGNIEYSGITKGSRGENKNFSSYDWCWHGRKYSGYVSDVRTKLYEYFYTTTALTDESYPNTYDLNSNSYLSFGGDSYTAIYTTHLHFKRGITFNATLNGDDPYALWINGEYVAGADGCCTGTAYSYTFNPGWYRIDMIYSESGGGDYVQLGWNPKDYTDYIDAMAPFGPLDFYNSQLSMRGGNVGIGTLVPAYKLDVSGTIRATGDVIAYSDARVKDNVTTVENALDKVKSLRGVTYTRKDDDTKSLKVGVIAQEVLPILPEVVQQDPDDGNYNVAYGNMAGVLIEAIKELKSQNDTLLTRIEQLENK